MKFEAALKRDVVLIGVSTAPARIDHREAVCGQRHGQLAGQRKRVGALEVQAKRKLGSHAVANGHVFAGNVVMTTGFDGALEAVWIGAKTRTTKKEPSLLGEVTKSREGKGVFLVDGPGQLA